MKAVDNGENAGTNVPVHSLSCLVGMVSREEVKVCMEEIIWLRSVTVMELNELRTAVLLEEMVRLLISGLISAVLSNTLFLKKFKKSSHFEAGTSELGEGVEVETVCSDRFDAPHEWNSNQLIKYFSSLETRSINQAGTDTMNLHLLFYSSNRFT